MSSGSPDESSPNVNRRVRERLAGELVPGEEILATVAVHDTLSPGYSSSGGVHHAGGTVFSLPYAKRLGIDYDDGRLRADLVASWVTVTPDRILFHRPKQTAVRPTPGDLIEAVPPDGVSLAWFDTKGSSLSNRVLHLTFPDGRHLLSATILKARLRRKTYSDEPDLFVAAFGAAATEIDPS